MRPFWLYSVSFASGYLIMAFELLGFRLLAPYFGYSIYVFGSLIGLVLFSLSAGYYLGGFLGDRNVSPARFFFMLLGAALYASLAGFAYTFILEYFARWGNIAGVLAATFVLFSAPMAALAAVSPYVIRVLATKRGVGVSAGGISAIATLGSLAGTFLTSFYFLPEWGTRAAFSLNVFLFLALAIIPLAAAGRRASYVLFFFAAPLPLLAGMRDSRVLFAADSAYNRIEVVDYGDFLGLRTDRRSGGIQSYILKDEGRLDARFLLYDLFAVGPALTPVNRALLLGVAGGVIPAVHERFGEIFPIDGVELDPKMAEVGRRYFHLDKLHTLSLHIADARAYLAASNNIYDLIELDLFSGSAEVPFHLATREFFKATKARLAPEGLLLMNLYDPSRRLIRDAVLNTIAAVYPHVFFVDLKTGSHFVLATASDAIAGTLERGPAPETREMLAPLVQLTLKEKERFPFDASRLVLTDDRAPIERLSYRAIYKRE